MNRHSRRDWLKSALVAPCLGALQEPPKKPAKAKAPPADPYRDGKLVDGEPPLPEKGSFTVAVLPDTQHYSERFPQTFIAQTKWIAEQKDRRRIAAVLHLGDITNRNTVAEWKNAQAAVAVLDGVLPFVPCVGNHDYSKGGGCSDRTTLLNDYFPAAKFRGTPSFVATYDREPDRMENSCHVFSAADREFLVLSLEFGPRRDVVRWANEMAAKYPKREAILTTHAYMYFDDTRYNWKKYGSKQSWNPHGYGVAKNTQNDVCDGEELWNGLVAKHDNFILTLNGHVLGDGLGRCVTTTPNGRAIPQSLVNFQMRPKGGDGWLRLLEFKADGRTVEAYDYSPTRKQQNLGKENRVTFEIPKVG